jgi:hypothetical protein
MPPATPKSDGESDGESGGPGEDVRRKFREALERKQQRNTGKGEAAEGSDASKAHGAHGPATTRRSFRRKSG